MLCIDGERKRQDRLRLCVVCKQPGGGHASSYIYIYIYRNPVPAVQLRWVHFACQLSLIDTAKTCFGMEKVSCMISEVS